MLIAQINPVLSIQRRLAAAMAFDLRAMLLRCDAALFRRFCRSCGAPDCGRRRSLPDQFEQAVARVLSVALLGTMALRRNDDDAVARKPPAGQLLKPYRHVVLQ